MKKVACIKDYKVETWPQGYTVKAGEVLYFGGYLRGHHPVVYYNGKESFTVFSQDVFKEHFKIEE